ncbi:MAG TPA: hypothetical protein VM513_10555 [Kofleriaceae bacterium]|nr:hypothetical protein [Kofleriaceae bacterium]
MHRWWIVLVLSLAACKTGGEYVTGDRGPSEVDRGEANGRMFDFVSNKPEGDDWQIRIRGTSLWVSYGNEDSTDELGARNLTDKEARKVWKLIDKLEIPERKKGKKDEDEGYVQLRLREPGGEEGHDIFQIYVSRATEDDDVLELAEYLRELVAKYHKEEPNF